MWFGATDAELLVAWALASAFFFCSVVSDTSSKVLLEPLLVPSEKANRNSLHPRGELRIPDSTNIEAGSVANERA